LTVEIKPVDPAGNRQRPLATSPSWLLLYFDKDASLGGRSQQLRKLRSRDAPTRIACTSSFSQNVAGDDREPNLAEPRAPRNR